jgi:predicted O-methyltransferase YrrM
VQQTVSLRRRIAGLVPALLKAAVRKAQRDFVLRGAVREIRSRAKLDAPIGAVVLRKLEYGWANQGWSARPELLEALTREAARSQSILECGSGISSFVISLVAVSKHKHYRALEHHRAWFETLRAKEAAAGVSDRGLTYAPLKSYGEFDWYDVDSVLKSDERFDLVLCDGPPGDTRGGRSGLLPVAGKYLRPGARILVDDANRPAEAAMIEQWAKQYGVRVEERHPTYAIVSMPL